MIARVAKTPSRILHTSILAIVQQRYNMGIHIQRPVDNWLEGVKAYKIPFVIVAVHDGGLLVEAKQANPLAFCVYRHWYDRNQQFGGTWDDNLNRARTFFAAFVDETFRIKYAPFVNAVKGFNEFLANSQSPQEINDRLMWEGAASYVWEYEYRLAYPEYEHIRYVLCSAAVGNVIDPRFAQIANEYDNIVSYHAYTYWVNKERHPEDWPWRSGRFALMEQEWGFGTKWLFSECGPYESVETGWRSGECLGGSVTLYEQAVREWARDVAQTAAFRRGDVLGGAIFNTGGKKRWKHYETGRDELVMIAGVLNQEWAALAEPPAPTPEPPIVLPEEPMIPDAPFEVLSQRNEPWKDDKLGFSNLTIGAYGCALTCATMVMNYAIGNGWWGVDEVNTELKQIGGFEGALLVWSKVAAMSDDMLNWLGSKVWQTIPADMGAVFAALENFPLILLVDSVPATIPLDSHFVVAYGATVDKTDLYIADPWDGKRKRLLDAYGRPGWDLARAVYGMYQYTDYPDPKPEPLVVRVIAPEGVRVEVERV